MMQELCLDIRSKNLPSEVGIEAAETLKLTSDLPFQARQINVVRSFLNLVQKIDRPAVLWVVGIWGLGKTAIFNGIIEPYCKTQENKCKAAFIIANKMFDIAEKIVKEFRLISLTPEAFLASILEALRESDPFFEKLPKLLNYYSLSQYLKEALTLLKRILDDRKLVIFVDEFERIYDRYLISAEREKYERGKDILEAIVELINVNIKALRETGTAGLIHLVFSVSEEADATIRQKTDLAIISGRLTRRFIELRLRNMSKLEVFYHLDRLIKYVFNNDKLSFKDIANPPTLFNIFGYATGGLPGNTEHLLNHLISNLSDTYECPNKFRKLDISNALSVYSSAKTSFKGVNIELINVTAYTTIHNTLVNVFANYRYSREVASKFVRLLLLSTAGVSINYLAGIFKDLSKAEIKDMITIANYAFREKYNVEKAIYSVKSFKITKPLPDFINRVLGLLERRRETFRRELERLDIILRPENITEELYEIFIDQFAFIDDEGHLAILLPDETQTLREFIKNTLKLKIESEVLAEELRMVIDELVTEGYLEKDTKNEYLYVLDDIVAKYIISPSMLALEFITDLRKRYSITVKARSLGWSPQHLARAILPPLVYSLRTFYSGESRTDHFRISLITAENNFEYYVIEISPSPNKPPTLRVLFAVLPHIIEEKIISNIRATIQKYYLNKKPFDVVVLITLRSLERDLSRSLGYVRTFLDDIQNSKDIVFKEVSNISQFDIRRLTALGLLLEETSINGEYVIEKSTQIINDLTTYEVDTSKRGEIVAKYIRKGIEFNKLYSFYNSEFILRYIPRLTDHIRSELRKRGKYFDYPTLSGKRLIETLKENVRSKVNEEIMYSLSTDLSDTESILPILSLPDECFTNEGCSLRYIVDYAIKNIRCHQPHFLKTTLLGPDIEGARKLLENIIPLISYGFVEIIECRSYDECRIRINYNHPSIITLVKFLSHIYSHYAKVKSEITSNELLISKEFIANFYKYRPEYEQVIDLLIRIFKVWGLLLPKANETYLPLFLKEKRHDSIVLSLEAYSYTPVIKALKILKEDLVLNKYGYQASGKRRGYRAWIIKNFIGKLWNKLSNDEFKRVLNRLRLYEPLELALDKEKLLNFILASKKIHLINDIIYDIVLSKSPIHENIDAMNLERDVGGIKRGVMVALAYAAKYDIDRLTRVLEDIIKDYNEQREALKEMLSKYVVDEEQKIDVKINELELVKETYEKIVKILNENIPLEKYHLYLRDLWKKTAGTTVDQNECVYGVQAIRYASNAFRFPFYYRAMGRYFIFNYKVYRMHETIESLRKEGIIEIDEKVDPIEHITSAKLKIFNINRYKQGEKAKELMGKIGDVMESIKRLYEDLIRLETTKVELKDKIVESYGLKNYLAKELESIKNVLDKPIAEASRIKVNKNVIETIDELENIYNTWRNRSLGNLKPESAKHIMEETKNFIESFDKITMEFNELVKIVNQYDEILDKFVKTIGDKDAEKMLKHFMLNNIKLMVKKLNEQIKDKFKGFKVSEDIPPLDLINSLKDRLRKVSVDKISSSIDEIKKNLYKLNDEVMNKLRSKLDLISSSKKMFDIRYKPCRNEEWLRSIKELELVCKEINETYDNLEGKLKDITERTTLLKKKLEDSKSFIAESSNTITLLSELNELAQKLKDLLITKLPVILRNNAQKLGISNISINVLETIITLKEQSEKIDLIDIINALSAKIPEHEVVKALLELRKKGLIDVHIIL